MDGPTGVPPPIPPDLARTPVAVLPDTFARGVQAPGTPPTNPLHCPGPGCPHTYDWREPPGSPGNTHGTAACAGGLDLREALETVYPFDGMLLGYVVCGPDGAPLEMQPRATKPGLAWLESQGFRVMLTCFLADLDNPKHGDWTPELRADYEAKRAALPELATAGDYITPHGARIVQPIWPWLPVRVGEIALKAWLERLRLGGLPDSSDTSDWTRCMRLPRALREGVQLNCELRTASMVPIAVSRIEPGTAGAPSDLEARILSSTGPKGAPLRAVTGPELARFADNLVRRTSAGAKASGAALKLVIQGLPWAPKGRRDPALFPLCNDLVREFWPCDLGGLAGHFALSVGACAADSPERPTSLAWVTAKLSAAVARIESEREARAVLKSAGFARGDAPELAARLAEGLRDGSPVPLVYDRGAVHRYAPERGVWDALPDLLLETTVHGYAGRMVGGDVEKPHPLNLSQGAIDGAVRALRAVPGIAQPGYFNDAPRGLAFANGFVSLRGGRVVLDAHSPDHRALHALATPYEPAAGCPETRRRLAEILARTAPEETAACVRFYLAFLAVCLLGIAPKYETGIILQGPKGGGKSVLLKLAEGLFPAELRCALTPHELTERFLAVKLAGKHLNARGEMSYTEIAEAHILNSVVTGDTITVQEKHRPGYELVPRAGLLFACNDLFGTRDHSGALQERLAVLYCGGRFRNTPGQVRDLAAVLLNAELPGIYAACFAELEGVVERNGFDRPASTIEANAAWVEATDPLRQWLREETAPVEIASGKLEVLHGAYQRWNTVAGHKPLSRGAFAGRLKGLGYWQHTENGNRYTLALKSSAGVAPAFRSN